MFRLIILVCLLACSIPAAAEHGAQLRSVVEEMAAALRDRALPPKDQHRFDRALANLRDLVGQDHVDMAEYYTRTRALLAEIDSDGHTFYMSKEVVARGNQHGPRLPPDTGVVAYTTSNDDGQGVLVFTPPPLTAGGDANIVGAADALVAELRWAMATGPVCALVVDLSKQTGGNAWAVLTALGDLITPQNSAGQVSRHAKWELVPAQLLNTYTSKLKKENHAPLAQFRGKPVAIVVNGSTASAGEMIAIALKGEPGNRMFGSATGGWTTINTTMPLSNGDMLALTIARYSLNNKVIRGAVLPDEVFRPEASSEQVLQAASNWARKQNCAPRSPQLAASSVERK